MGDVAGESAPAGGRGPAHEDAADEVPAEAGAAAALAAELTAQTRRRAIRLARVSRLVFAVAAATAIGLVLLWVFGGVDTSEPGFRVLALGVVVLFALAFLTGALSAAALRRAGDDFSRSRPRGDG